MFLEDVHSETARIFLILRTRFVETKIGPKRTLIVKLGDIKLDHELGLISLVLLSLSHPPSREEGTAPFPYSGWLDLLCMSLVYRIGQEMVSS